MHKLTIGISFFVFSVVYLLAGSGLTIVSHYCEGELQEVALNTNPEPCCEGETSDQADDCCENNFKYFSASTDIITISNLSVKWITPETDTFSLLFIGRVQLIKAPLYSFLHKNQLLYPPPDKRSTLIISTSVLRI